MIVYLKRQILDSGFMVKIQLEFPLFDMLNIFYFTYVVLSIQTVALYELLTIALSIDRD